MAMTRRDFVKQTVAGAAVPSIAEARVPEPVQARETVNPLPVRVGMTDWNLGQRGDISKIALAREIGLDGIQVSVQYPTDGTPTLRDTATQAASFVAMMREVARYAEKCGVVVGLEDWISAEDNIRLLDAIGSDYVAVYYDAHNLVARAAAKDVYAEPKLLGKRISQIHVKNANMLLSTLGGKIDWPRMAQQFYDIGYRGWYVLETDSPTKDTIADTRANIEYVKKTFRMPPSPAG